MREGGAACAPESSGAPHVLVRRAVVGSEAIVYYVNIQ